MELYDDRPLSVYDNLKTPTNHIRVHTSTPKALKSGNAVAQSTATPTTITKQSPTSVASLARGQTVVTAPLNTKTANGITSSPIYADISYKFDDSNKKLQQQQQQQQQNQQTYPGLSQQQHSPSKASVSNFSNQATAKLQFVPLKSNGKVNINNYTSNNTNNTSNNNNKYHHTIAEQHANASITMPAASRTQTSAPPLRGTTAATTTTTTPTLPSSPAAQQATLTQRPLSQHSQSEVYEASQSIAAVKAALNDAKSKFFGLNGYAQDNAQQHPNISSNHNSQSNNNYNNNNANPSNSSNESRLPRLLIESQFPRIQIVTTEPTPPPKSQPKYQNIPENSAIFRNQQAAPAQQQQHPPELPPKPVDAITTPSRMANAPSSSSAQPDGAGSTTPNSAVFSTHSTHSTSPTPTSPLDTVKLSLSPAYAAYKQIPMNDIDISQPSQAVYMATTVPQNIKGSKIAGRHTPTRNSLRHSRMLVVNNKIYPASKHPNPMNLKHPNLARWLLILEIIVGLLISFLAIWIFCLAPNTPIQYNPYWSGLVLLLTGILGLVLVRYQRIKRHKVRENCFKFLRADIYLLALLAVLLCVVALFCATLHYARLSASDTRCASSNPLVEQGACTCTFNVPEEELNAALNSTSSSSTPLVVGKGLVEEEVVPEEIDDQSYKVEYWDLSCKEVRGEWTSILRYSMALNALGFLLAFALAVLLVSCRQNAKRFYTSVHTSTF